MRKRTILAIAAGCFGMMLFGGSAHADGYGTAGCGLGSILFGDKPGIIQIFAATTNGISANQTFAISTGTSNCSDTSKGVASAKAFIQANREAVSKDIARGTGETIASLSSLAGCADQAAVGTALQKEFKTIFPNEQVSDISVSDSVVLTLRTHAELACRDLG